MLDVSQQQCWLIVIEDYYPKDRWGHQQCFEGPLAHTRAFTTAQFDSYWRPLAESWIMTMLSYGII